MTFVNELILSPLNSANLMFVKDSMTAQMVAFLNSWIIVNNQLQTGNLITYHLVVVNTHEREWKDMSGYGVESTASWIEIGAK
jgi:hypothetical protein